MTELASLLCAVFLLVAERGGCSLVAGFTAVALLQNVGLGNTGFSSCGAPT